ncbi:MAG: tRNA-dihydrouridine synthase [Lentisphaerae bacterium]|nr:tRNA-dihydrouridine synthase [Lentisphaerota bacterium]
MPNRVLLSPLAGVSDAPFRRICQELGAGLTYVEMLLSSTLQHASQRRELMLARHAAEPILGVQLTGPTAESVAEAAGVLNAWRFDTLDLNMGCPVRKIVSGGAGCAILQDPDRVSRTARLVCERSHLPVSAKIRLGYDHANRNVVDIVRRLAGAGVAMITIHGRTRLDHYGVPVDFAGIAEGVAAARAEGRPDLVVTGNGDIFDPSQARRMLDETGCDAVLVSRGALGNPWLFAQILAPGSPHPRLVEWREVLLRHLRYHCEHYGADSFAIARFRKHLLWYVSGFRGMRRLREDLSAVQSAEQIVMLIDRGMADTDPDLRRYVTEQQADRRPREDSFDPKFDMDRHADRALATAG